MILPITHYDYLRKERARAKRSRLKLPKVAKTPEYIVYFVRFENDLMRLKVGRTRDLASRISSYEEGSGLVVHCYGQFVVGSQADVEMLEQHTLEMLRADFPSKRLEWFIAPDSALSGAILRIVDASPVPILAIRGFGRDDEDADAEPTHFEQAMKECGQYRMKRRVRLRSA
jgi:hypothetical protein